MKSYLVLVAVMVVGAALSVSACAPTSASVPPTPASAAAPKAAQPTASAAAPAAATSAPAAQSPAASTQANGYPASGRPIQLLCGFAAGGLTDIAARLVAAPLSKELGTSVEVVDKPGASSQVAMTDEAQAKPDGYTLGEASFPPILTSYLDPKHKATYNMKSFEPVAAFGTSDEALVVKAGSPYKTLKDLVDAAKANPGKIKLGDSGALSSADLLARLFQDAAGVKLDFVMYNGAGETVPALLGGHVDVATIAMPQAVAQSKAGKMTVLATTESGSTRFLPSVKNFQEQGYNVSLSSVMGVVVPAGTPKDIVATLSNDIKTAVASDDFTAGAKKSGITPDYMDPDQFSTFWTKNEKSIGPLLQKIEAGS